MWWSVDCSFDFFFQICVNFEYHSQKYHKNNMMILKKSNKNCYNTIKTWQFIGFFNTINKLLKKIINHKLFYLIKHYNWLFVSQIKIKTNQFMKMILKLFIKQIHTMWNTNKNKITTLLKTNIILAFLIVNHEKLIYNFHKKNVSTWIINWIVFFVHQKNIILLFINHFMKKYAIHTDLLQKSLMSFIFICFLTSVYWTWLTNWMCASRW